VNRRATAIVLAAAAQIGLCASGAAAQQSLSNVLTFLVTNRSIPTDDFAGDAEAAAATRSAIGTFLTLELGTVPTAPSAGGFAYRLDPTLGMAVRASDSFGPFFTARSLTGGAGRLSFVLGAHRASFDRIEGRNLQDGTLVSTASTLRGESQPFDVETLALRMRSDTASFTATYGITDRLDVSATIPFVRVSLEGERVDNYRGRRLVQATGSAAAAGLGDIAGNARFGLIGDGASGLALGGEVRLPTGSTDDLLGSGSLSVRPMVIGSLERGRTSVHGNLGYVFSRLSQDLSYAGATTVVVVPRVTLVGELTGLWLRDFGRLVSTTAPHPSLIGVDTIRLTSITESAHRLVAAGGVKWNVAGTLLLNVVVMRQLTDAGLSTNFTPIVTLDYSLHP
jgi:hypothetical protein